MLRRTQLIVTVAILSLAIFVGPTANADGHSAVKAAIQTVDDEFMAALKAGSAERLAGVYTEDGQALPPNSDVVSGRQALIAFWRDVVKAGIGSAELQTVELEIFGESAVQLGRYVLKGKDGKTLDNGKLMILWKKVDGNWRWHRDIWNSSRPPE